MAGQDKISKDATITTELENKPEVIVIEKEEVKKEEQKEVTQAPRTPTFQIKYPSEQRKFIKMIIYGKFGVGKTFLGGTSQDVKEMTNVINIDADGGNKVLDARGDIPTVEVRNYDRLNYVYEYLRAHCLFRDRGDIENLKKSEAWFRGIDIKSIKKPTIFNTVTIDSISEVVRYCMYKKMGIDIETTKLDIFSAAPEYKDRYSVIDNITLMIRKFRDLPMHVIFVSASKYHKDELGRMIYNLNIEGALANDIQGFVDHVGYYTMEINESEEHRYLVLKPGATYQAKNRFKNFTGRYLIDPIMQDIYDLEVLNKSVPARLETK